ncbi:MAG: glycosyltransferase family 2 protein [Porticoccaceae bacterium]|nr:glycosyltransferase family 2 protein [Pseudomonadales bacterium]MCP5171392.1 glycosyltransferase family 2 protein [Pseudomonadales bacterium]
MTDNTTLLSFRPCAIVPVYNHPDKLTELASAITNTYQLPIIFIDDGSTQDCHQIMAYLAQHNSNISVVTHQHNQGKGAAIKTGLHHANNRQFSHALQIDADGQHSTSDIPKFIQAAIAAPDRLIAGYPAYDNSIPKLRYYGRYLSHIWVWINTLSTTVKDSMCGFRVYPIAASCQLIKDEPMGNRMEFDGEFIVRWFWRYGQPTQLETKVIYPENNLSNFQLLKDNKLISLMHARLFFGMLVRLPKLISAKWRNS